MTEWNEKWIIYEDADLVVCRKPAGLAVQSARIGQKDLVSLLNNYRAEKREEARKKSGREQGNGSKMKMAEPVHVVHRLDQPVEGVLVFAKTKAGAAGLSRQITDGSMEKIYYAVCCVTPNGENYLPADRDSADKKLSDQMLQMDRDSADKKPADQMLQMDRDLSDKQSIDRSLEIEQQFCLTDYLIKDGRTNTSRVAAKGQKDAKEARLRFCILNTIKDSETGKQYALVKIHLETGRHHQIRVQMANAGLPLYGDQKYNPVCAEFQCRSRGGDTFDLPEVGAGQSEKMAGGLESRASGKSVIEPALCASELVFWHPTRKKEMHFKVKPQNPVFEWFETQETV